MGRNKYYDSYSKTERKRLKDGTSYAEYKNACGFVPTEVIPREGLDSAFTARDSLDTRSRRHQTSNNWIHAVLFVVLLVIVVAGGRGVAGVF